MLIDAASQASGYDVASFWVTLAGTLLTLAALVFAIAFGIVEVKALRREAAERAEAEALRDARRRRTQAASVSARLVLTEAFAAFPTKWFASVEIVNASALPIYLIEVRIPVGDGKVIKREVAMIPGGGTENLERLQQWWSTDIDDGMPIEVAFRDAANVLWVRFDDGPLHELPATFYDRADEITGRIADLPDLVLDQ